MAHLKPLQKLILQHKYKLGFTYALFCVEMTGSLLRPYFFGVAVNDLLIGSYNGLVALAIVHVAWLIIGTLRHMYDTRCYTKVYTSLVTSFMTKKIEQNEVSKMSAHSILAREFVDFLEYDLVYIIEAMYNLFGSLLMLYFLYDRQVVLVCLCILIPVIAVSYFYGKKMKKLTKQKNDELEKQIDIISSDDKAATISHYERLRNWQIRISDQEAWNFGIMEILVVAVICFSLLTIHSAIGTTLLAGSLIGIYNYILKFVSGLDTIPYTVQRAATLLDIADRIDSHTVDIAEALEPHKLSKRSQSTFHFSQKK